MRRAVESFTDQRFEYYVDKFRRRLFRRLVEYTVLQENLPGSIATARPAMLEMLQLTEAQVGTVDIKDHVEKACLTGLKAEFELFFSIYCTFAVNFILDTIEREGRVPKAHEGVKKKLKVNYAEFYRHFLDGGMSNAKGLIINSVMPNNGLGNFESLLKTCGWTEILGLLESGTGSELGPEFSGLVQRPWDQIHVAFQVRHAIEHTFSKVGEGFLRHAKPRLGRTTWRTAWCDPRAQRPTAREQKLGREPALGDRVLLSPDDIRATAASMSWATSVLEDHWRAIRSQAPDLGGLPY